MIYIVDTENIEPKQVAEVINYFSFEESSIYMGFNTANQNEKTIKKYKKKINELLSNSEMNSLSIDRVDKNALDLALFEHGKKMIYQSDIAFISEDRDFYFFANELLQEPVNYKAHFLPPKLFSNYGLSTLHSKLRRVLKGMKKRREIQRTIENMVEKDHKKATRYDYMIATSKIDYLTARQKRKIMYSIAKSKKTKLDKMVLSDVEFSKNCPNLEESRNTKYIISTSKEKEKLFREFCSKNNIKIIKHKPYI